MIGFDRPLKPEWIYELLNIVKDGENSTNYNVPFENIAYQLIGKEGKRKVRTIIFRSFIYSLQEKRGTVKENRLIELSKKKPVEYMKPIYLMKLIFDYEIIQTFLKYYRNLFSYHNRINTEILSKKYVQEFGDRDISKRSLRSFLKTLQYFNVLNTSTDSNTFEVNDRIRISAEQFRDILILYGHSFLKSNYVDLEQLDTALFTLFDFPEVIDTALMYNNRNWEYIRTSYKSSLILKTENLSSFI